MGVTFSNMIKHIVRPESDLARNLELERQPRRSHDFFSPTTVRAALAGLFLALIPGSTLPLAAAPAKVAIEYNRDIRPILVENCFGCHGADSASRKGGLRLDHFEFAIAPRKDSLPAIVPNQPDGSGLIKRINATNQDDVMPPVKTHKVLKPEEKSLLTDWIASGAKYQAHWSLIAPQRATPPVVKDQNWVRNPIDGFILARLESEGLTPAAEADRRTLIRRVTLDLIGLPPRPEEVEAFVKDTSPDAYEKVVDRLLASPRWGEHRARYWLDAARYADTHGIHFDNYREMWSYRDWVIQAFNRNEHFDQFTIDQLAGDLLPNHTLEQEIASGFNRCNMTSNEGGLIEEEYLVLYARDRTETTSQVWLGTTAGCSVCHDHKFDPLPMKDFYSMSAFFNNTTQRAMDGNIKDTPPVITIPLAEDRPKWDSLTDEIKQAQEAVTSRKQNARSDFDQWLTTVTPESLLKKGPLDKPAFSAMLSDEAKPALRLQVGAECREVCVDTNTTFQTGVVADQALKIGKHKPELPEVGDFDKDQPFSFGAWVYLDKSRDGSVFARMDDQHDYRGWDLWLQGGKPATHIIHKWPDDALKVVANRAIESKRWTHVFVTYDGSLKVDGVKIYLDGELQETSVEADKLQNTTRTTVPFKIGQRHTTSATEGNGLQDLRIYSRALAPGEVKSLAIDTRLAWLLHTPAEARKDKEKDEIYRGWLTLIDPTFKSLNTLLTRLKQEESAIKMRGTVAHVMHEKSEAATAYLLFRGDYDKRRDQVTPNTPTALPPLPAEYPRNRLGFAKWLLLPEHPLTSRVTVNRFWQELFGTGIVRTAGDFGVAGELPSHQELLDWLAVEFRESGWDIKKFYKLMVTSATYRQAATVTPEKTTKDLQNRLLSRGPRFRMDGEMVRDYALAASGLLVSKIGGPSVKPYQPEGVWEAVAMFESNTHYYQADAGDKLYRRSLYTFWKRAAPPGSLEIFNAPSRETCTVRRERTDTPLQALVTMNDPQFVEAARNLAQLTLKECGGGCPDRLDYMAQRILARPLRPTEHQIVEPVFKDLLAQYQASPKDAEALVAVGESKADAALDRPTLAAYTMMANELFNLDEVLNK